MSSLLGKSFDLCGPAHTRPTHKRHSSKCDVVARVNARFVQLGPVPTATRPIKVAGVGTFSLFPPYLCVWTDDAMRWLRGTCFA